LARTVRDVRNLFATSAQLEAAVQQRQTDLAAAQSDLARRQRLGTSGAVSGEELQHAIDAVKASQAALLAAQQQLAANRARVDGTTLKDHPQVRDAAAAVRNAYLTLARTELPAPVSGFVARRNVQLGQRVSPGTALMAVVPLEQVWVDANFKDPQLAGASAAWSTDVFDSSDALADARVAAIIAANQSASARAAAERSTPDRKLLASSPSAGVPLRLHAGAAQQPSVD